MPDKDEVMEQALAVERGELPSGSVVVKVTGEDSLTAPGFGYTPLCEEDPDEPGWCAYHREQHEPYDDGPAPATPEQALIEDTLDALEHLTRELNVHALGLAGLDFDTTAELLARVQLVREAMQSIEAGFLTAAWKVKGDRYGDVDHPTLGRIDVRRGKNRSAWDHDALAGAVLDAKLTESGGELPDPGEVKRWLLDAAGIAYWRKTALKELGIDVDDYCASSPGKPSIRVVRSDDTNPLLLGGSHD